MSASLAGYFDTLFADAGYERIEPPILQDADIFLDLAGEDLRRRLYLTPSADGVELCLRPDYTIPVCLHHLTTGDPKRRADYAYFGPVFRQRSGETGEFFQAGVESIGRDDRIDADADVLELALTALAGRGVPEPQVRIGDSALFAALLEALALPDVWRRRLARAFGNRDRLDVLLARLAGARSDQPQAHAGFLAALDGADHMAAHRVVEDLLSMSGIRPVGGRSVGEIADRFLEQATLATGAGVDARVPEVLKRFLAIAGGPAESVTELKLLATDETLTLAPAIDNFEQRAAAFAQRGIDPDRIRFAADFGRRLDYYTGFVFEVAENGTQPVVGGGRYDRLLSLIVNRDGSGDDIPAVGFALWTERLPEAGR